MYDKEKEGQKRKKLGKVNDLTQLFYNPPDTPKITFQE
jgi:hypothetical protein